MKASDFWWELCSECNVESSSENKGMLRLYMLIQQGVFFFLPHKFFWLEVCGLCSACVRVLLSCADESGFTFKVCLPVID
jgi:hypothetical protein